MPQATLFTIDVGEITRLAPARMVEFLRRLLWAEGSRVGIGQHLISVPNCINVPDGGIDAVIYDAAPSSDEVIPRGTTGFQVKASNLTATECRQELHVAKDTDRDLKPEVKRLLDDGGTYVLVLSADVIETDRQRAVVEELHRCGYDNPVRVYTATKLQGFVERHPGVVAWLKERSPLCLSHDTWARRSDINVPNEYCARQGENQIYRTDPNCNTQPRWKLPSAPRYRIVRRRKDPYGV